MRCFSLGLWLGSGCVGDKAPRGSAEAPDDSDSAAGELAVDCGLASGLSASVAEAEPGAEVELAVTDLALPEGATLSWASDAGLVEADPQEQAKAAWTLSSTLALHVAELAQATATLGAPGCLEETHAAQVTVDRRESDRVVVVYNPEVERSLEVAQTYAASRGVDEGRLCAVSSEDDEVLPGEALPTWMDTLTACLDAAGEQIHYVVPVYGVPYKVADRIDDIAYGTPTTTSLDALVVFGRASKRASEAVYNSLYQEGDSMAGVYDPWVPFGELRQDMRHAYYLVTRIDGASADAALALVERTERAVALAGAGALAGTVYVDGRYGDAGPSTDEFGSYESGDWNMQGTRAVFEALGLYDVVWDGDEAEFGTPPAPTECPDALYYAGWYSYYHYNDVFTWNDGAIAAHLDSCSACSLRDGLTWSSAALERGVTATFGAVNEPYVAGMPEYDQLFLYLLQGASFGEAAYESTQVARWMMVFVGDPLYRPYPGGAL